MIRRNPNDELFWVKISNTYFKSFGYFINDIRTWRVFSGFDMTHVGSVQTGFVSESFLTNPFRLSGVSNVLRQFVCKLVFTKESHSNLIFPLLLVFDNAVFIDFHLDCMLISDPERGC